jgi:hypothetical protein
VEGINQEVRNVLDSPSNFSHKVTQRGTKKIRPPKITLIKNFWESRTLFTKRVLAAGGKSGGGFRMWKFGGRQKMLLVGDAGGEPGCSPLTLYLPLFRLKLRAVITRW